MIIAIAITIVVFMVMIIIHHYSPISISLISHYINLNFFEVLMFSPCRKRAKMEEKEYNVGSDGVKIIRKRTEAETQVYKRKIAGATF